MQCAPEGADFGEITQNKGHGAGQGHSKSPVSVPIESSYVLRTWVGPRDHVLDGGSDPHGKGQILGGEWASHCKV